jgi:hypothetical protein
MLLETATMSLPSNLNIVSVMFTDVRQCSLELGDPQLGAMGLRGLNSH